MYRVVMDRGRWFSVAMGESHQLDARTTDKLASRVPFPEAAAAKLAFRLEVAGHDAPRPERNIVCGRPHPRAALWAGAHQGWASDGGVG